MNNSHKTMWGNETKADDYELRTDRYEIKQTFRRKNCGNKN